MTFEWTGNRVPATNVRQVLRGAVISRNTRIGTNATFRYPAGKDGYGTVADAIRQRVDANLHTDYRATRIDTRQQRIFFANDRSVDYSVLLSTIPLPELVRIATDAPPEVSAHAAALRTNSIMVVNLGVARADLSATHWIHFPEKDVVFFRISFPHNFTEGLAPPGTSAISAEVSYPPGSPPDPEALTQRVIDDLVKVRLLKPNDRIIAKHTRDIPYGYCIYDEARRNALAVIKEWLPTANIVAGGRYGLWTYFWSDEAILSGKKSAELAKRRLAEIAGSESLNAFPASPLSRISQDPDAADS
jgi:UDP-galactopyranose mutase